MYNHAPTDYVCPICLAANGIEDGRTQIAQSDIFYRDDLVMGFIRTKSIKGNEGHPLLVPVQHAENIFDLPNVVAHAIMDVAQQVALALKETRKAAGVTLIQNNEPAGDQHAFHFHLHVIPRFENDRFHEELWKSQKSASSDRKPYADELRTWFLDHTKDRLA